MAIIGAQAGAGLRAFLLALAVIDDIAAILIIAVVYSTGVVISWGAGAIAAIIATFLLQKFRARSPWFYLQQVPYFGTASIAPVYIQHWPESSWACSRQLSIWRAAS